MRDLDAICKFNNAINFRGSAVKMTAGFARDQYGEPWIIVQRSGSLWALGLEDGMPIIRFIGNDNYVQVDSAKPNGIRNLYQVPG